MSKRRGREREMSKREGEDLSWVDSPLDDVQDGDVASLPSGGRHHDVLGLSQSTGDTEEEGRGEKMRTGEERRGGGG
jgi:hypothetical protein